MKLKSVLGAAGFALMPVAAHAGGFDLTGQPADIIFQEGNYIEAQVGIISPTVEGNNPLSAFGGFNPNFGNIANDTLFGTAGVKVDFTDRLSGAVIYDTPFLRSTTYNDGLFAGTAADVQAITLTAMARFKINENFSIYGGPRLQRASIDLQGPTSQAAGISTYDVDVRDTGFGFVVGAAAEIPAYKMRAAVTYNSAIDHGFNSVERLLTPGGLLVAPGSVDVETPQSVNLELQAPVSSSTLVQAKIRWVNWGGVEFRPPLFQQALQRPVVEYTEDTITYRLTVAQRLNENFIGFVTGSYEADGGEQISLFKSVDGSMGLGGGIIYENEDGLTLRLAGEYYWLEGTSGVQSPGAPPSRFDDASAFGASFKVGYRF